MKKGLLAAAGILAVMVVIGYLAISSSSYVDVSELKSYRDGSVVTVKGRVADTVLRPETDLVIFILEGEDGSQLYATYSLSKFISQYGAPPGHNTVEQNVVMKGVYHPSPRGKILGYMDIQEILQGCHKAYEAPPATG